MRSFWEDQVFIVTQRKHQDSPVQYMSLSQKMERGGLESSIGTSYCHVTSCRWRRWTHLQKEEEKEKQQTGT